MKSNPLFFWSATNWVAPVGSPPVKKVDVVDDWALKLMKGKQGRVIIHVFIIARVHESIAETRFANATSQAKLLSLLTTQTQHTHNQTGARTCHGSSTSCSSQIDKTRTSTRFQYQILSGASWLLQLCFAKLPSLQSLRQPVTNTTKRSAISTRPIS